LFQGFNAADMRNVCTEAGMAAIRVERDYAVNEDFMLVCGVWPALFLWNVNIFGCPSIVSHSVAYGCLQAVRKLTDAKKLESSANYKADF
jgi:26S proteasome regulatory subunit T4